MARALLLVSLAVLPLVGVGCSCNQEYDFPAYVAPDEVEPPATFGTWLSMGVAPDGQRLTLSYYDREQGGAAFAVGTPEGDGITWVHEHVDGYPGSDGLDRGDMGMYGSHVVAKDGTVWYAYKDAVNGGLHVGHRLGPQNWEITPVDLGRGMGNWASIAVDAAGSPVIAHHDDDAGTLRICHLGSENTWACAVAHEGEDAQGTDENGEPTTIDAKVGEYARLLIHDGVEHVAFYDAAWGSLNLLEGADGAYTHTVVDDGGDVGQWPDLAVIDDKLYLSYHDVGDQDLMLAVRDGGQWNKSVVDDGAYVGADSELVDNAGELSIVYFDGYNNDLKVATEQGGSWTSAKLAGDGVAVGFHNEVAVVGGRAWTASYDYTVNTLFTSPIAAN